MKAPKLTKAKTPTQEHAQELHALCERFTDAGEETQSDADVFKAAYEFLVEYVRLAQGFNDSKSAIEMIRKVIADPVPADPRQVIVYGVMQRCMRGDFEAAASYFNDVASSEREIEAKSTDMTFAAVCFTAIASRARPNKQLPHRGFIEKWLKESPEITPNQVIERFDSDEGQAAGFVVDQIGQTITAADGSILNFRNVKDRLYDARKRHSPP